MIPFFFLDTADDGPRARTSPTQEVSVLSMFGGPARATPTSSSKNAVIAVKVLDCSDGAGMASDRSFSQVVGFPDSPCYIEG